MAKWLANHPPWTGFIDDPRGVQVVVVASVFPAITTLFVGLRIFAREKLQTGLLGVDDLLIVISLCLVWALAGLAIGGWHYGLGRHAALVPLASLEMYLKGLYWYNLIYVANFSICKMSILFFLRRIFAVTPQRRHILTGLMWFIIIWTVAFELAFVFQCTPIHRYWRFLLHPEEGTCVDLTAIWSAYAATNVLTDVVLYVYPICLSWNLQVSRSQRFGLIGIFMAGAVVVALSTARAVTIRHALRLDLTWEQVTASILCILEVCSGIIVACLPAMRSIFVTMGRRRKTPQEYKCSSCGTSSLSKDSSSRPSPAPQQSRSPRGREPSRPSRAHVQSPPMVQRTPTQRDPDLEKAILSRGTKQERLPAVYLSHH